MAEETPETSSDQALQRMTAEIVSAFVQHNPIPVDQVGTAVRTVYAALSAIQGSASEPEPQTPAVSIRRSITPGYLVCLEDGRRVTMLRRHLRQHHGMTPDEYRQKWQLPSDYPMIPPRYARQRSAFAKSIGLGRSRSPR